MIRLTRLPEPDYLAENRDEWLAKFLADLEKWEVGGRVARKPKPDHKQYGHKFVRESLRAMSHHKCFYCERKLLEGEQQIDHYVDVAIDPQKAFDWDNLYLCCADCNKKLPTISVDACIDPCGNIDPEDHLTFDKVEIKFRSDLGENTVSKYKLERGELDHQRTRALLKFVERLLELERKTAHIPPSKRKLAMDKFVQQYRSPQQQFSLMFYTYGSLGIQGVDIRHSVRGVLDHAVCGRTDASGGSTCPTV